MNKFKRRLLLFKMQHSGCDVQGCHRKYYDKTYIFQELSGGMNNVKIFACKKHTRVIEKIAATKYGEQIDDDHSGFENQYMAL